MSVEARKPPLRTSELLQQKHCRPFLWNRPSLGLAGAVLLMILLAVTSVMMFRVRPAEQISDGDRNLKSPLLPIVEPASDRYDAAHRYATLSATIDFATDDFILNELLSHANFANLADIDPGSDSSVKVRTLLDRAARNIPGKFKEEPATESAIRMTMGRAYLALGEPGLAQQFIEGAIALCERSLGTNSPDTLRARCQLAELFSLQGKYASAEKLFLQSMPPLVQQLTENHDTVLVAKTSLATLYQSQGKYSQAATLYEEVLKARTSQYGPDHPQVLIMQASLGWLYKLRGNFAQAHAMLKSAFDGLGRTLGNDHPDTLAAGNNLAEVYARWGKLQQAEALYSEIIQSCTSLLGKNHRSTLMAQFNLASVYSTLAQYAQSRILHEEVYEARRQTLGAEHPQTLASKNNLAGVYHHLGQWDKSEKLFAELLQEQRRILGPWHPDTLACLNNLGTLYLDSKNYDRAARLFRESLFIRYVFQPLSHPDIPSCLNNLAVLYSLQNNNIQAEKLLEELLPRLCAVFGQNHPQTLNTRFNLAAVYRLLGKRGQSMALARESLEGQVGTLGSSHPATLKTRNLLVVLYQEQNRFDLAAEVLAETINEDRIRLASDPVRLAGLLATQAGLRLQAQQYPEAEPLLRECLAIREKHEPDTWTTGSTASMLGGSLLGQDRYEEAESYLLEGYEGMKQCERTIPAQGRTRLIDSLDRLIQLYQSTGKGDELKHWQTVRRQTMEKHARKQ